MVWGFESPSSHHSPTPYLRKTHMVTAVETLSKLERRMTLTLPKAEVQAEVDKLLKLRARTAKKPGFRPGKVPLKILAAEYGGQIENDVLNVKLRSSFAKAAEENSLQVAGLPKIELKPQDA